MKTGILYTDEENVLGVNVSEEGKKYKISDTFSDLKLQNIKKPVIGLPFDKFIVKTVKLPKLSKDELKKAIELQEEFVLGEKGFSEYMLNSTVVPYKNGNMLFIVATYIPEIFQKIKSSIVVPVQIGLYAYAYREKLISNKKVLMLVYIGKEYTHLVVVNELNIVFMRTFTSKSDINSEIRLSEQAVYLQQERFFLNIDEYIIFAEDDTNKSKIEIDNANIRRVDISKNYHDGHNLTIQIGLSFYSHSSKYLSGWNIAKKPLTTSESFRRSLFWVVPILLLFLPVYYYADYYNDQKRIAVLEDEIAQFSGPVAQVEKVSRKLRIVEDVIKKYGTPTLAYAKFKHLLKIINDSRPKNLWLTNISGKVTADTILTGFAQDFSEISSFIKDLNKSNFIKTVNLNYSNASNSGKINFQLTIRLNSNNNFILEKVKDNITGGIATNENKNNVDNQKLNDDKNNHKKDEEKNSILDKFNVEAKGNTNNLNDKTNSKTASLKTIPDNLKELSKNKVQETNVQEKKE